MFTSEFTIPRLAMVRPRMTVATAIRLGGSTTPPTTVCAGTVARI